MTDVSASLSVTPASDAARVAGGLFVEGLKEVSRGAEGVIYRLSAGEVAKVFFDALADDRVEREYAHSALAHGGGIPTWKVDRLVRENGRRYIVGSFEAGRRLSLEVRQRPYKALALMRRLGALHGRLHRLPVDTTATCPSPDGDEAAAALAGLVGPVALTRVRYVAATAERGFCHGDLSLTNMLYAGERLIVLDWARSGVGPLTADVGRTCAFILASKFRGGPRGLTMAFRRMLVGAYVGAYVAETGRSAEEIRLWTAVFLARKLGRPLPQDRLAAIRAEAIRISGEVFGAPRPIQRAVDALRPRLASFALSAPTMLALV